MAALVAVASLGVAVAVTLPGSTRRGTDPSGTLATTSIRSTGQATEAAQAPRRRPCAADCATTTAGRLRAHSRHRGTGPPDNVHAATGGFSPARPTGKLVPSRGALLGGYISPDATGWHRTNVTAREAQLGRKLDIDHRYDAWTTSFPSADDVWDVHNGRIPMVTWEPWGTTLDKITSGADDALIRARAADVAKFGKPIFLRWAHEMNGDWYPWAGSHNNTAHRTDGPTKYVAVWRHIHTLFAAAGATNAVWVWCPNRLDVPNRPWNAYQNYYPGDGYVDWVCIDGYNRDASSWKSFSTIFSPIYATYCARKPIMIGETASVEGRLPGQKAQWIADAQRAIKSSFPSIAALLWFDTRKDGNAWSIDSSPGSFAAFRSLGLDDYFRSRA